MAQVLKMPMMGNTMEVGVVVEWVAAEGEVVSEGDTVLVVESEKAANDIVAEQDGELTVEVPQGEEVPPGTRLGVIGEPGETETPAVDDSGQVSDESGATDRTADGESATDTPGTTGGTAASDAPAATREAAGGRVPAAPGARKRAGEADIPLAQVDGSGPDGAVLIADLEEHLAGETSAAVVKPHDGFVAAPPRVRRLARELGVDLGPLTEQTGGRGITALDVRRAAGVDEGAGFTDESAIGTGKTAASTESTQSESAGSSKFDPSSHGLTVVEERQLTGMRRTIARRMSQSAREKPHVTLNRRVDADRALAVVEEYSDSAVGIGLTDLLVCAAIDALQSHPEFNAWYEDGTLSLVEEVNVGTAVDIEGGLVTPVLRDGAGKTPVELAEERAELTAAVQSGAYDLADIQGGTFTITNLGMLGVDSFDPIINPPEIAILGVGRIRDDGDGPAFTLSLSFDHRVVDGADAARFLDTLATGVTSPAALIERRTRAALE